MNEEWRKINGFSGFYEISDQGGVRSIDRYITQKNGRVLRQRSRFLSICVSNKGYYFVLIQGKSVFIHRLIAEAFIPMIKGKNVVNHKNSIPSDNSISNLEWCTQSENILHGYKHGNAKPTSGSGKENHNFKTRKFCKTGEIRKCVVCGAEFIPPRNVNATCSRKCASVLSYRNRIQSNQ